ncbi:hypothetical protein ACOME3_002853 [Neoechinorhynchus agilis]
MSTEAFSQSTCTCSPSSKTEISLLNNVLNDKRTVRFLLQTKVMFILRGLPGSGKSYISRQLCRKYPEHLVCSADHFFIDPDTKTYNYNFNLIHEAHLQCRSRALRAVSQHRANAVIVDNTNIRYFDEIYPYVKIAILYSYLPIVLETVSDWRTCFIHLCERNTHGVPNETLKKKVSLYRPLGYFYYGLFPGINECGRLCHQGEAKRSCSMGSDFSRFEFVLGPSQQLHMTTMYNRSKTERNNPPSEIREMLGRIFTVAVVGFVFTANISLIRLRLIEPLTWVLFRQPENTQFTCERKGSIEHPTCGFGHRAHMTLWTKDVKPVHAGECLLRLVELEHETIDLDCDSVRFEDMWTAKSFGDITAVYLAETINIECLFNGGFSLVDCISEKRV